MSKDIMISDKTYTGVSAVNFNTSDGGIAVYKDVDEITSGGSFDISTELTEWAVTEGSVAMTDFFGGKTVQLPFTKGVVVFHVDSDTAPTEGQYTMQNMFIFVDNAPVTSAVTGDAQLIAPNSIGNSKGLTAPGTGTVVLNKNTKILTFYSGFGNSTIGLPANASIKVGFIPFNFDTGLVPQT